MQKQNNNCQN